MSFYQKLSASLMMGVMAIVGMAFANPITTMSADLESIQKAKGGVVKPSFGLSPNSGLREGEMRIGEQTIIVELALDGYSQAKGLMFRESMPENSGMLFMFSETQPLSFWMKNTLIPLDIIYITEAGEVVNIATAQPCKIKNCPLYPSIAPAKYVLELNAGRAAELGLKAGDNISWSW
ncbi:DUF192 domain-containing protein [Ignatzschineria rhizosphaerae]|uniref:DUF192 domain-containing protein n=1 Tax=Ignatzschineria rhizosphaerae TaxID=2923279 RepID=A0ABY3WZT6_9GAMM|nr:DUF192 domain-containing protein [Ignatzschineria rhizosphaerae]UNM96131.1 DUF192 domain-containing protein [Ignatzschineria rhizosphaerae]